MPKVYPFVYTFRERGRTAAALRFVGSPRTICQLAALPCFAGSPHQGGDHGRCLGRGRHTVGGPGDVSVRADQDHRRSAERRRSDTEDGRLALQCQRLAGYQPAAVEPEDRADRQCLRRRFGLGYLSPASPSTASILWQPPTARGWPARRGAMTCGFGIRSAGNADVSSPAVVSPTSNVATPTPFHLGRPRLRRGPRRTARAACDQTGRTACAGFRGWDDAPFSVLASGVLAPGLETDGDRARCR